MSAEAYLNQTGVPNLRFTFRVFRFTCQKPNLRFRSTLRSACATLCGVYYWKRILADPDRFSGLARAGSASGKTSQIRPSTYTLPWQCWKSKIQALPQVIWFSPEAREFSRPVRAKSVFRQLAFPRNCPIGSRYHVTLFVGVAVAESVPVPAIMQDFSILHL